MDDVLEKSSWTINTVVFSCSKDADTDWRKKTFQRPWFQVRKSFRKKTSKIVQKLLQRKLHGSVVFFWHFPVCQNYISESGCKFGDKCLFRHTEADRQPVEEKWWERISYLVVGVNAVALRVPRDRAEPSKKSIQRKSWKLGSNCTINFSKGTWHHIQIGKERVHRKELFKNVNLKNAILLRQNLRTQEETLQQERCARKEAWNFTKKSVSSK